jgi:hypothetical protein
VTETRDVSCLSDDLCGGQGCAAADCQQVGSELGDQWLEFLIERVDLGGQLLAAFNQGARQAGDKPVEASESYGDRGEVFRAPQSTGWKVPGGVEFMQVPAQPVDHAGPFGDEVVTVVSQQADLATGAIEASNGQIGLAQGRAGYRQRVDRVGFAVAAGTVAGLCHELGRNAHDALPGTKQISFKPSG